MKIALVSAYDYPYPGGVTEHIACLDRYFRGWGHTVKILAHSTYDLDKLEKNVIKLTDKVFPLPVSFSGTRSRISLSPGIYRRVRRVLEAEQFDVVHLHEPMMPALPLVVLRHSHAVNIGTFHAYRENHAGYYLGRHILHPFFERLDGKIAVSAVARDMVYKYFPSDYRIIPNGIDVESYNRASSTPLRQYRDGRPTILFVGRMDKRKGFEYLLHAFPLILAQVPNARLVVVGAYSKEDIEPYVSYVAAHNIPNVEFVGYVTAEDKPSYYCSCDVFCAPSTGYESFGIVLLEAMAAGTALVASDIPGYRSVVEHGRQGLLVEPENPRALAEALSELLRHPEKRQQMGEEGRRTAAQYSWERVAGCVLEYYREILREKGRRIEE